MLHGPLATPQPTCTHWRTPRKSATSCALPPMRRAAELSAAGDPDVGDALIEQARRRATPALIDVLNRYPLAPVGKSRVAHLMKTLDTSLRTFR
jgi:hypothetical protein